MIYHLSLIVFGFIFEVLFCHRHEALDRLQVLALGLVIQDMSNLILENPRALRALVNPDRRDPHWPGRIPNSQLEIPIVSQGRQPHEAVVSDIIERIEDLRGNILLR